MSLALCAGLLFTPALASRVNRSAAPAALEVDAGGATADRATPSADADGGFSEPPAGGLVDADVTAAALGPAEVEEPDPSTTSTTHVHRKSTTTTSTTAKPKAKPAATKESATKAGATKAGATKATTTTTQPKAKATTTSTTLAPGVRAQTGLASWFSAATPGTCAHRSLPKGTKVWVEAVDTAKEITCTVNDRGPYVDGRIIDLNHEDFHQLAGPGEGVVEVRISW